MQFCQRDRIIGLWKSRRTWRSLKDLQVSSDVHKWRAQRGKYDKQCGRDLSVEASHFLVLCYRILLLFKISVCRHLNTAMPLDWLCFNLCNLLAVKLRLLWGYSVKSVLQVKQHRAGTNNQNRIRGSWLKRVLFLSYRAGFSCRYMHVKISVRKEKGNRMMWN